MNTLPSPCGRAEILRAKPEEFGVGYYAAINSYLILK